MPKRGWNKAKLVVGICIIATTMAACYQDDHSNSSSNSNETGHADDGYDEISLSRYKPPIVVTMTRETSEGLDDLLSNLPGETLEDNRWSRLYEQVLGIRVEYDWTARGEQYHKKLGVMLASGKIPDIVKVDAQQLRQLSNAGLIQDLTAAYETYASQLTKEVHRQEGLGTLASGMLNGKLMGIPETDSSIERAMYIWMRTDWLERLALQPPRTMDELLAVSKAFTTLDPDQNGEDDTFGIAISSHLWDPVMGVTGFMAGYGAYPNLWLDDGNGGLVYGGIQPEVKQALQALQQLYRSGQLDNEFMFKNGIKVKQQIAEGQVGIMYGEQWGSFVVHESRSSNPESEWRAYPIVSATEDAVKVPLKFSTGKFYAVRKDYEFPEAIIKMFNLHLEKNWGETAEYETFYNTTQPVWQLSPVTPFPAAKNLDAYRKLEEARRRGDQSILNDEARFIQKKIDAYMRGAPDRESGWGWEKTYGPNGAMSILDMYEQQNMLLFEQFVGAPTETMMEKKFILDNLKHDAFVNIMLGNSIDEFDQFVQDWLKLGGHQITTEVNQWYAERDRSQP